MEQKQIQQQETVDGTPSTAPDLTVTKYQQLADDFLKALTELAAAAPLPTEDEMAEAAIASPTLRSLNLTPAFIAATTAAAEASPAVQAASNFDVAEAREALQFIEAWGPVLTHLRAVSRRIQYAVHARRSRMAAKSSTAYAVAQGLVKNNPNSPLVPHLQAIKQAARFHGGKKKGGTVQTKA